MSRPIKRPRTETLAEVQQVQNLEESRVQDMGPKADVFYIPSFIGDTTANEWYDDLLKLDSWYQPKLKVYGKEAIQSRKIAAYATDSQLTLKYSGQMVDMRYEYPPLLRKIQDEVEERLGVIFNHVMLNLYEDGNVYIGNHRDNQENRIIASVSLGAPRTFIMSYDPLKVANRQCKKPRVTPKSAVRALSGQIPDDEAPTVQRRKRLQWTLDSGSLLVMQGDTQRFWKHQIPKEPKVKEGRISLTFRQLES